MARKFAKLFDVADTQVLYQVIEDSEGNPSVQATTELNGAIISMSFIFDVTDDDEDKAWDEAQEMLDNSINQETADSFYASMTQKFGGEGGVVAGLLSSMG